MIVLGGPIGVYEEEAYPFVVGETAVIGDNVSILHDVTLGGTGKEHEDRHPKIRRGVMIGAGAKITDAYVGPFTSIGEQVEIRSTEIEHSIILEGSRITDMAYRIEDSLIGRNVTICRMPVRPTAYRFMLGDNSEVGIRW